MSNVFNVGNLDLSGITDAELAENAPKARQRFITEPGKYTFVIEDVKLSATEKQKDHAGKQWGSIYLKASDVETGNIMVGFVNVPLETTTYTYKNSSSNVPTKIFCNLMSSLLGRTIKTSELPELIGSLETIASVGKQFVATVRQKSDIVKFMGENDAGEPTFGILLVDGSEMVDADGAPLRFMDREAAANYYLQVKGYNPGRGLEFGSFLQSTVAQAAS